MRQRNGTRTLLEVMSEFVAQLTFPTDVCRLPGGAWSTQRREAVGVATDGTRSPGYVVDSDVDVVELRTGQPRCLAALAIHPEDVS